jgi:hypothetical protein
MKHQMQWHTPSPLWSHALEDGDSNRFQQPAILRFASDNFMDDLAAQLGRDSTRLKDLVIRPETWSAPDAGWQARDAHDATLPVKLFQPAHARFYLISASLVCRISGLPDKNVDTGSQEKVGFVIRRLVARDAMIKVRPGDSTTYDEYGWQSGMWLKLAAPESVQDAEERLPMFPLNYTEGAQSRRLLTGLIPVSSRETYQAAGALSPVVTPGQEGGTALADARQALFDTTVSHALAVGEMSLRAAITRQLATDAFTQAPPIKKDPPVTITQSQAIEVLVFALLDLAEFLQKNLPQVWAAVFSGWSGSSSEQRSVYRKLDTRMFNIVGPTWVNALRDVWSKRERILAGEQIGSGVTLVIGSPSLAETGMAIDYLGLVKDSGGGLYDKVIDALKALPAVPATSDPEAAGEVVRVPKFDPQAGSIYIARCVYDRPHCPGPGRTIVSPASAPFQLASFFDPDAPVRPVRITMPVDTSVAGLRKFPKSVSFLISDQLRKQISRVDGVKISDLDDGDLNDEQQFDLGMICSMSIPIITICAMILLMIIVKLLNIVFQWVPFFKICLPLNLKAR